MIHISNILPLIATELDNMQPKDAMQFRTYKKDRGFIIYCLAPNQFQLLETGFIHGSYLGDLSATQKMAKKVLKKEFPRSNMVWVDHYQQVENPQAIDAHHARQGSLF
ncbi:hypothetical protein NFHSH190041_34270 [Shewanella sp. NFH-SH190041]|uniref:hypothetical protein n=1 Tax=Shewanella sp. NFH-SH190041 TaxID=2950245 RepID=UPI0021C46513|nr:hypothetical protein [Shewanella sp. NFH-SH190041]BDM65975.1 hypothetical protein NFHSH190041_34270 [Shewanella sp. NFH-SH190041]